MEFEAPVSDILFALNRVAGACSLPGWDEDLASEVLTQFARLAETSFAPLNASGDAEGCRLEQGRVRMPGGFREAYRAYADQGWPGLALPERYGGQGMPAALQAAVSEVFAGANHALQMICDLVTPASRAILGSGSEEQAGTWLPRLAAGQWLATMCLSEAGAGSDLSRIRTRAIREGQDWAISGEKIFVSGGDQDMSEGILHLVLARTGDAGSGSHGLSLFLCPSVGEDGKPNDINVIRIEDKLGLHAAPTCQLAFDGARAELLGHEGEGLRALFPMMNHARLDVALQGIAHAARASAIARSYAAERRQGRLPGGGPTVTIDRHGDVRRMLDEQQALVATGRALCYATAVILDRGEELDLVDFMTPVCKFLGAETGVRCSDLAIQVLGGYGYLREYAVEQIFRDVRITPIYEGANGIHAMTLAGRLLRRHDGIAATAFRSWIGKLGEAAQGEFGEAVAEVARLWSEARRNVLAEAEPGRMAHAFMQLTVSLARQGAWVMILAQAADSAFPKELAEIAHGDIARLRLAARYWAGLLG